MGFHLLDALINNLFSPSRIVRQIQDGCKPITPITKCSRIDILMFVRSFIITMYGNLPVERFDCAKNPSSTGHVYMSQLLHILMKGSTRKTCANPSATFHLQIKLSERLYRSIILLNYTARTMLALRFVHQTCVFYASNCYVSIHLCMTMHSRCWISIPRRARKSSVAVKLVGMINPRRYQNRIWSYHI